MLVVDRTWDAGAICVGKTNTPEFGAGSQTFNTVFGATKNPYDLTKTCGGSSGGAGVALATGMLPLADGSDLGASLRNPGNFSTSSAFVLRLGGCQPVHPPIQTVGRNRRQASRRMNRNRRLVADSRRGNPPLADPHATA